MFLSPSVWMIPVDILNFKCDGTRAETRFRLSAKRTSNLNLRGLQFSRLVTTEVCASAVVMVDTPRSEVVWRVLATHSIRQFPFHFLSHASPCAFTFQRDSTSVGITNTKIWRRVKHLLCCSFISTHLSHFNPSNDICSKLSVKQQRVVSTCSAFFQFAVRYRTANWRDAKHIETSKMIDKMSQAHLVKYSLFTRCSLKSGYMFRPSSLVHHPVISLYRGNYAIYDTKRGIKPLLFNEISLNNT